MKFLLFLLLFPLAVFADEVAEKIEWTIVELPRPNSGTFSFAQAEARKSELLSNATTSKLETWKNPYMGFCVHVDKEDRLTVYGHWAPAFEKDQRFPRQVTVAEVKALADGLPLLGNPAGILITSDRRLSDSKIIHEVLKATFVPSIQIFYARRRE